MLFGDFLYHDAEAPKWAVIYAFKWDGEYLYIGKSWGVTHRIIQHWFGYAGLHQFKYIDEVIREQAPYCFDWEVEFIELEGGPHGGTRSFAFWMKKTESIMIAKHRPKYNIAHNPDTYEC